MIYEAISYVSDEMNEFFRNKLKVKEDKIIISSIVDQNGHIAITEENRIVITLINLEKELTVKGSSVLSRGGQSVSKSPSININLYLLFSAYFASNNYAEALQYLSFVIAYMQSHNVFVPGNTSGLEDIDKITLEIADISTEQLNNIWGTIGAKYMPSVVYKLRMLTLDESAIREIRPMISGIDINPPLN